MCDLLRNPDLITEAQVGEFVCLPGIPASLIAFFISPAAPLSKIIYGFTAIGILALLIYFVVYQLRRR